MKHRLILALLCPACGAASVDSGAPDATTPSGDSSENTDTTQDSDQPAPSGELVINEFMASNMNTVADETGAFPDWIELYNNTSSAINLGGYTITDDLTDPGKHVLSDTLNIEPGGFLILWADGDVKDGNHHLSFKLTAIGEDIGLYDLDGLPLDELTYDAQVTDISQARTTDGTGSFASTDAPTPGESNN